MNPWILIGIAAAIVTGLALLSDSSAATTMETITAEGAIPKDAAVVTKKPEPGQVYRKTLLGTEGGTSFVMSIYAYPKPKLGNSYTWQLSALGDDSYTPLFSGAAPLFIQAKRQAENTAEEAGGGSGGGGEDGGGAAPEGGQGLAPGGGAGA